MIRTIESQFKMLVDIYIKEIDYLEISRLFAKYESYATSALELMYFDEANKRYIETAKELITSFFKSSVFEIEKTNVYINKSELFEYIYYQNDRKQKPSKTKYYYILKTAFVVSFYKRIAERINLTKENIESIDSLAALDNYQFFRGQTNYGWRMSPSILRNLQMNIILDDNYYYKLLNDNCKLEDKYNDLIKSTKSFSAENKYNKYAFLQHACSYSPFIDFTKKPIIAASFALSNASSFNDFRHADSSIICMRFNEDKKDNMIKDRAIARSFIKYQFKMEIINSDYFVFGKSYELIKSDGTKECICIFSFDELLDRMTPDYRVFDIPTNDRMLYQKGLFVCFFNCLCFKDFIAYELCPDLFLSKIRIEKKKKRNILNNIYKHYREYDPEHLMDPYLFFRE